METESPLASGQNSGIINPTVRGERRMATSAQIQSRPTIGDYLANQAHLVGRRVQMSSDCATRRVIVEGRTFETLLGILGMRQLAFEPGSHAFRPHKVQALPLVQRIDRLWAVIMTADEDEPGLLAAAGDLRDIAEAARQVRWDLA
jgi:hypothetical protein